VSYSASTLVFPNMIFWLAILVKIYSLFQYCIQLTIKICSFTWLSIIHANQNLTWTSIVALMPFQYPPWVKVLILILS